MSWKRLRLLFAFLLYVGWLSWLAVAVYQARWQPEPVRIISRGQLTAAEHLVVAKVTLGDDGLPRTQADVTHVIASIDPDLANGKIEVLNLGSALPADNTEFPGDGEYLLLLAGKQAPYRIVGLPRSPGFEATGRARPRIYEWNDNIRTQLKELGYPVNEGSP